MPVRDAFKGAHEHQHVRPVASLGSAGRLTAALRARRHEPRGSSWNQHGGHSETTAARITPVSRRHSGAVLVEEMRRKPSRSAQVVWDHIASGDLSRSRSPHRRQRNDLFGRSPVIATAPRPLARLRRKRYEGPRASACATCDAFLSRQEGCVSAAAYGGRGGDSHQHRHDVTPSPPRFAARGGNPADRLFAPRDQGVWTTRSSNVGGGEPGMVGSYRDTRTGEITDRRHGAFARSHTDGDELSRAPRPRIRTVTRSKTAPPGPAHRRVRHGDVGQDLPSSTAPNRLHGAIDERENWPSRIRGQCRR